MTEQEVRLKVLEIIVPTASRNDISKADIVKPGGIAEQFVEFVNRPPAKAGKG